MKEMRKTRMWKNAYVEVVKTLGLQGPRYRWLSSVASLHWPFLAWEMGPQQNPGSTTFKKFYNNWKVNATQGVHGDCNLVFLLANQGLYCWNRPTGTFPRLWIFCGVASSSHKVAHPTHIAFRNITVWNDLASEKVFLNSSCLANAFCSTLFPLDI